jgi:hypothetical protein
MIELYTIKCNNTYTYYSNADASSPTAGDTLLCDTTGTLATVSVTRGYTYTYTTTWVRSEAGTDVKTTKALNPTISNTLKWLNNYFYVTDQAAINEQNFDTLGCGCFNNYIRVEDDAMVFNADGKIETTDTIEFIVGDLVYIQDAVRNKHKVGYLSALGTVDFTLDRTLTADTSYGVVYLTQIPEDVEDIISKMIWYDIYQRDLTQDGSISTESEGSYSVSYDTANPIYGILYPKGTITGLLQYRLQGIKN